MVGIYVHFIHKIQAQVRGIYYDLLRSTTVGSSQNTRHTVGLFSGLLLWTGKLLHELQLVYQIYANDINSIFLENS